jgi:hypothetical protein
VILGRWCYSAPNPLCCCRMWRTTSPSAWHPTPRTAAPRYAGQLLCCLSLLYGLCRSSMRLAALAADMPVMDALQVVKKRHIGSPFQDTAGARALDPAPAAVAATSAAPAPSATQAPTSRPAAALKPRATAGATYAAPTHATLLQPATTGQVCGMHGHQRYTCCVCTG